MARKTRIAIGGHVYHVMNRAAGKRVLFSTALDFGAFETVIREVSGVVSTMRIVAYCLMPTHWHFLLWPLLDTDLPRFLQKLESRHALRWNVAHGLVGHGAVYQSRYKSIPIGGEENVLWVWRYVERNALRANLVQRAEEWRWGSLSQRGLPPRCTFLADGPCPIPANWVELVNAPQSQAELDAFRKHVNHAKPFGSSQWSDSPRRGRPRIYVTDQHQ